MRGSMATDMDIVSHAVVTIESVTSQRLGDVAKDDSSSAEGSISKEQFMHISLTLPEMQQPVKDEQTHLILVVDRSGSMAGSAWKQVQDSLKDIIKQTVGQKNLSTHLITYADNAKIIDFDKNNYNQVIDGTNAGGMTNFKSAFVKLCKVMDESDKKFKQTVIVFMTDGNDTVNSPEILHRLVPKLTEKLAELETQSVIHAVGFTSSHDFKFMKVLAEKGGKTPGMFRYCEPGDSRKALQDKLDELFTFILLGNEDKTTLDIQMEDPENVFLGQGKPSHRTTLKTQRIVEDSENSNGVRLVSETWVLFKNPSDVLSMMASVQTEALVDGMTKSVSIPCIIDSVEYKLLESAYDKTKWRLRILSRNVDELVTKASIAVTEKKDTSNIQTRIEKYQNLITHLQVFGNGITKEGREKLFTTIKEIQGTLDQVQSMLAEYVRAGTESVSLLARAHDLRYKAVFSKSRRQRTMDKRASKNMAYAADAQKTLSNLTIDEEEVDQLSQDALGFYFCVLSQNSIRDVLLGDDKEDAIGFGLAVKRSEVVLDEPTLIKVFVISGTLVSRTAMLDALEYKINVSSHMKAHGGFSFEDQSLGVTTVGAAREPINAWLPLYITKSHWDRVKVIVKPALGSFCTLDPLGYHYKQLDVMFMVLGSMIGQLNEGNVGEHQLRLIFAVQRTCAACMADFDLEKQICDVVEQFILSPAGRTRDVIAHLHTLIGYIVAMPVDKARSIFKIEDDQNCIGQFWLGFIAEWLRRAAGGMYKNTKKPVLHGLVSAILYGTDNIQRDEATLPSHASEELVKLCLDESVSEEDIDVTPYDPLENVPEPTVELEHDQRTDRAMEIWAEKTTGHQKNLGKTKKYKDALRAVQSWNQGNDTIMGDYVKSTNQKPDTLSEGAKQEVDSEDEIQEGNVHHTAADSQKVSTSHFDCQTVNMSMLKTVSQLQHKLCRVAYPSLETLPGCMAFVNNWLFGNHCFEELDRNSGVAPTNWIQDFKNAVRDSYRDIKDYTSQQLEDKEIKEISTDNNTNATAAVVTENIVIDINAQSKNNVTGSQVNLISGLFIEENVQKDVTDLENIKQESTDMVKTRDYDKPSQDCDAGKKMGRNASQKICLAALLYLVDHQMDTVLVTRAILCQVINYHSNSDARSAISAKEFIDISGGNKSGQATLQTCHTALEEYRHTARRCVFEKAMWKRSNYCMVRASTPWAFVGYLMNTYTTRSEGFTDLIELFLSTISNGEIPPYLREKMHILFTGKYKDCPILEKGNQLLPIGKLAEKVLDIIGQEAWDELNTELRSSVQIHVYRESDIPNRHGHCNSNPYIPNSLREKLGMPLMSDTRTNLLRRKHRKR